MPDLTDMQGDNPPEPWSIEQARKDHEALQAANQATMKRLPPLDPVTMLKVRLDHLTLTVLGGDEEAATKFEVSYEQFLSQVLAGAEEQVRLRRLNNGVMPGQLVIPGAG